MPTSTTSTPSWTRLPPPLTLDGTATQVELGGFQRYAGRSDVIKLHAGDAITGTRYPTLFRGEADAALMNTVCFDAFALGNHEFDNGDAGLKVFLDHLRSGSGQTPVLAANVTPQAGTPLAGRTPLHGGHGADHAGHRLGPGVCRRPFPAGRDRGHRAGPGLRRTGSVIFLKSLCHANAGVLRYAQATPCNAQVHTAPCTP